MKHSMLPTIAKGAMEICVKGAQTGSIQSLGITSEQFELITGPTAWSRDKRQVVVRILDLLLYGQSDLQGLDRFTLPAEYQCAVYSFFVHPVNFWAVASWMPTATSAMELAYPKNDGSSVSEPVTSEKIFSMMCMLVEDGQLDVLREQFAKRTGLQINKTHALNQKQKTKH